MNKKWFWDRKINSSSLKKILSNPKHTKFIQLAALILSRENIPKEVFKYIKQRDFCENWNYIKKQMRKNKWSEARIIFWQAIYEKLLEKLKKEGIKLKNKTNYVKDEICVNIGNQIKEIRMKKSLTQSQLSKKLGISQQMLSRIESGKENVSLITLKNIVKKLGAKLNLEIEPVQE